MPTLEDTPKDRLRGEMAPSGKLKVCPWNVLSCLSILELAFMPLAVMSSVVRSPTGTSSAARTQGKGLLACIDATCSAITLLAHYIILVSLR